MIPRSKDARGGDFTHLIGASQKGNVKMGPTRTVGQFIASSRFTDLPDDVIHSAKRHILDTLGVALLGATSLPSNAVLRVIRQLGGKAEATVIGQEELSSPFNAALANGTMAYSQMMDDTYSHRGLVHPGNHVIPAALAMAERTHRDGKGFLTSVIVGYEVSCRTADAVGVPHDYRKGFSVGSTNPHFGAAAAAANLLRLDERRACNALGLAGTQACGLFERGLLMNNAQPFHAGKAASSGILAALLAAEGLVAGDSIFEGVDGYLATFSSDPAPSELVEDLGVVYRIDKVGFKFHPAPGTTAPSIDAAISLHNKHQIAAESIVKVTVGTHRMELAYNDMPDPDGPFAAVHSNQYCVARSLVDGRFRPRDLTAQRIAEPRVRALMKRVRIELDPELDAGLPRLYSARVVVETGDGKTYQETVHSARGTVANPASDDQLAAKFLELTRPIIGEERAAALGEMVWNLDAVTDIRDLTALLRIHPSE